jgi:16S rRNA U516 pseudouridylate synthase RsuA-like enzyme
MRCTSSKDVSNENVTLKYAVSRLWPQFEKHQVIALIRQGHFMVNGKVSKNAGKRNVTSACKIARANANDTEVPEPEGGGVAIPEPMVIAFHKPVGCTCSRSREREKPDAQTVFEVLNHPNVKNLMNVGRLDKDTSGLLLFTTEGRWIPFLTSPHANVSKTYHCTLRDGVQAVDIQAMR